jgi:putative tryptophan/tyrosine transport system substrate-binding protein
MKRRDFITLLGGAAAWPVAAWAQQPPLPMIGFLNALPSNGPAEAAFRKGLAEAQLVEGRDFAIEFRHADNDYSRLPSLATELVQRRAAVIYANGGIVAIRAAKEATSTIPIVFAMGDDPVASGVVESLNRPGGNVTGVAFLSTTLGPKRLGLLKELVPAATRYALLVIPPIRQLTRSSRNCAARPGLSTSKSTCSMLKMLARSSRHLQIWRNAGPRRWLWEPVRCSLIGRRNSPPWRHTTICQQFITTGVMSSLAV